MQQQGSAPELIIATMNPAKAARLNWVFADLGFKLVLLPANVGQPPEETAAGFRANAELKARHWSSRLAGLVAASDGGISIPALGEHWDALRTARAAGAAASDAQRAAHLLRLAANLRGDEREVSWSEGLALARAGKLIVSWQAQGTRALLLEHCDPTALRPGFWAASLSYVPALGRTLADLQESELPERDPTWSGLREQVVSYFSSRQAGLDCLA